MWGLIKTLVDVFNAQANVSPVQTKRLAKDALKATSYQRLAAYRAAPMVSLATPCSTPALNSALMEPTETLLLKHALPAILNAQPALTERINIAHHARRICSEPSSQLQSAKTLR
jgi:hypothetical protein